MTTLAGDPALQDGPTQRRKVVSTIRLEDADRGRVLVADPCADIVESTALLLQLWGYEVCGAATGTEALAAARAYRPDIVLMEIGLPGLDGFEVARRLRKRKANPECLLVAITGHGDAKNKRRSQEAGFDYHLVKPVDPCVLQALLAANSRNRATSVATKPGIG